MIPLSPTAAIVWKNRRFDQAWIAAESSRWVRSLGESAASISRGAVIALSADYSPQSIALLSALLELGCIVAPLTPAFARQKAEFFQIAEVSTELVVDADDQVSLVPVGNTASHPLLRAVGEAGGLILFSSGSAGKAKAVVHDGARLLRKYQTPRRPTVTIPFMLFDHIGGINTVLHTLSSGGTAVIAPDRNPETICALIEAHHVEVLPTSPTFVNLLLLSDYRRYDLSSLKIIAYGAERMPAASLERLRAAFPGVQLIQNYGLSEVGIMATKSEANNSLWVKLGGDGYETRVRDGLLEIKAETAMLGYLNEASPFTEDGWLKTGDRVEVKGEYVRILGRRSDLIIIGGEKVYPAEIEDLIAEMPEVIEVTVGAEANALTGNIVKAEVRLATDESRSDFRKRMTEYLAPRVPAHKIPQKVSVTREPLHNARFKKTRVQG